jgi:hypothetical protein
MQNPGSGPVDNPNYVYLSGLARPMALGANKFRVFNGVSVNCILPIEFGI